MVNEKPDEQLPDLNLKPLEVKELRKVGSIDKEIKLMKERMNKPFPKDEVTICAMGATRYKCPFDTETWAVNMGYWQVFQVDGHFSTIFLTHIQVKDGNGKAYFDWEDFNKMADAGITVYNTHRVKGLNSKMYPFKKIVKKYGTDYFSNTIAYMIALAIDQGYKKINIYGCDMMTREEYAWEKGGIEFWLGVAYGLGVKVTIADGSSLLQTITGKPYGVKYFNLKDIDPTGSVRRTLKKFIPKSTSTSYMYESPLKPPNPEPTQWVSV